MTLGGGKVFQRDITSSSRLAYLAADDPIIACNWLVQDEVQDAPGHRTSFTALDIKEDGESVNRHQLIALYDNRASSASASTESVSENSAPSNAPKPRELVEAALRLLKPRTMPASGGEPALVTTANYRPIKLVPASWIMMSSGDYTLLSISSNDK